MNKTTALQALTSAALAIPGLAAAEVQTEYLYAHYQEADLPASRGGGQSSERYEINSHRFRLTSPLGEATAALNLTLESMSGASPWYILPDANGKLTQVMSGASISEERADVEATLAYPVGDVQVAVSLGYSKEDDYEAFNGGAEFEHTPEGQAYSFSGGIGYSYDRLEPTVGRSSLDVIRKADRDSLNVYGGVSFILGPQTVLQTSLGYALSDGYLSDPYKQAYIQSQTDQVPDNRPGERSSWTASARLRQYVAPLGAALHVDYRYYDDEWDVTAHTLEVAWHQTFADTWRLTPSLRYYTQSQAYFYAPYYQNARADGLASSDYRLSPYGALSVRLDLRKAIGAWELGGGIERYEASADYALESVKVENPGLVEYLALSLKLAYRF